MLTTFVEVKLAFVISFKRALVTFDMVPDCEIIFNVYDWDLFNCWLCTDPIVLVEC